MMNLIIILLYAIGNQFEVSLIGQMSVSDIGVLLFYIYLPTNRKLVDKLIKDKDIIHISLLYLALLIVQLVSETILGNTFANCAKSVAVTILSFLKFIFLWLLITRKEGNIKWLLLFTCIATTLFKDSNQIETAGITDLENMGFMKFYLAPLVSNFIVLATLYFNKRTNYLLFIIGGIVLVSMGARSSGLILLLTGLIAIFILSLKEINKFILITRGIFLTLSCYVLYVCYVNAVLSGIITTGNSGQTKLQDNPYNPIEALFMGRSESFIATKAFTDSPWIGQGAWANDVKYKYHILMARARGDYFDKNKMGDNVIPTHSVILGYGVNNGIFAIIFISIIILYFCYKGGSSLHRNNPYIYLVIFSIVSLWWNGLFSPVSHFRYGFPAYFVYCFFSYKWMLTQKRKQKIALLKKRKDKEMLHSSITVEDKKESNYLLTYSES